MFETVQLRHFATKYDRLQQFFGLTTKYGQTRQNTTLLQQRPPLATVVEGSKDRVVEHKGLFYGVGAFSAYRVHLLRVSRCTESLSRLTIV